VYEPEIWRLLLDQLRPDDIFVDVGANVGLYSIAGARRVPDGRVWAVEPDPRNAALLRRHVDLNGVADRVTVIEAAAGDGEGDVAFSALGIPQSSVEDIWESGRGVQRVPLVRLDQVVAETDVMKIDVEGYEGEVLAGSAALLSDSERKPRLILVEVHPELLVRVGWTIDRLRKFLVAHDYLVNDVEARHAQLHWLASSQEARVSVSRDGLTP
jgi:FkbM family methyltransferase